MFCSVAELHKLGYIHRDLKPEVSLRPNSTNYRKVRKSPPAMKSCRAHNNGGVK
jgi:serine/threonine protein kinase